MNYNGNKNMFLPKIGVAALIFLVAMISCKKQYVCKVDTHTEHWGINGISPDFKSYLVWVKDTTEYFNTNSTEKNLPRIELKLSESRIDSFPSAAGEDVYLRTIVLKKARCYE